MAAGHGDSHGEMLDRVSQRVYAGLNMIDALGRSNDDVWLKLSELGRGQDRLQRSAVDLGQGQEEIIADLDSLKFEVRSRFDAVDRDMVQIKAMMELLLNRLPKPRGGDTATAATSAR